MDRRLDPRYPADLEVRITNLSTPSVVGLGRLTDISDSGVRIVADLSFLPGDLVQVDVGDSAFFGYVAHSGREAGAFTTGIEMERVLFGNSDLSHLLQNILEQNMPEMPGVRVAR